MIRPQKLKIGQRINQKNLVHHLISLFHKQCNITNDKSDRECKAAGKRTRETEREATFICYYIPFVEGARQILIISLMIWSNNGGDGRVDMYI